MATVGDDREQNVVAGLGRTVALLDRLDALIERGLIALEGRRRLGGEDLAPPGRDRRYPDILAKVSGQDDVREAAEHRDQFRHVDETGETRDRLVFAGGLQLEFGRGVAEGRGPGVEFMKAALHERRVIHQALHREHFAEGIGDRRA